jgi:hypothetical protein
MCYFLNKNIECEASAHKVEVKSPKRGPFTSFFDEISGLGPMQYPEKIGDDEGASL